MDDTFLRVSHRLFPESRCAEAIARAREFFSLPPAKKQQLAIERSPHFRGYSVMESDRDWREQIHFGKEEATQRGPALYEQLRGPNLWPEDAGWRAFVIELMDDLETAGREILRDLGIVAGHGSYPLLKMIHYRSSAGTAPRSGVAPHVDFSWITLLIQDATGGLEMCTPEGVWTAAPPAAGTLLVNFGEILEFATRGRWRATPHRVLTGDCSRISLPYFLNPALDAQIEGELPYGYNGEPHVHRVFASPRRGPFLFGEEEWKRKGLGVYCETCCSLPPKETGQVADLGMRSEYGHASIRE